MADSDVFTASIAKVGGHAILSVHGEIDIATEEDFEDAMRTAFDVAPHVIIDLSEVAFLGCSALRAIVRAQIATEGTGTLRLRNVPRQARRVFELATALLCEEKQTFVTELIEARGSGGTRLRLLRHGSELRPSNTFVCEANTSSQSRHPTGRNPSAAGRRRPKRTA
jgi:anti-anti-sigma factor